MMSRSELITALELLHVSQTEAARLLSVGERTFRRWMEKPEDMPGPAAQAVRAWVRLEALGLAWRPDSVGLGEKEMADQIARHRQHALELDATLQRVKARGGPRTPWQVDLARNKAVLGPIEVGFYRLRNGGFSPATYTRRDRDPDIQHDWPLIEDAFACIAAAMAQKKVDRQ